MPLSVSSTDVSLGSIAACHKGLRRQAEGGPGGACAVATYGPGRCSGSKAVGQSLRKRLPTPSYKNLRMFVGMSQMKVARHRAAKKQRTVSVVVAPLMKGLLQALGVEILHRLVDLIS